MPFISKVVRCHQFIFDTAVAIPLLAHDAKGCCGLMVHCLHVGLEIHVDRAIVCHNIAYLYQIYDDVDDHLGVVHVLPVSILRADLFHHNACFVRLVYALGVPCPPYLHVA